MPAREPAPDREIAEKGICPKIEVKAVATNRARGKKIAIVKNASTNALVVYDELSWLICASPFLRCKDFRAPNCFTCAFADAYADKQFVQQVAGQIPWDHNVRILDQVKSALLRKSIAV